MKPNCSLGPNLVSNSSNSTNGHLCICAFLCFNRLTFHSSVKISVRQVLLIDRFWWLHTELPNKWQWHHSHNQREPEFCFLNSYLLKACWLMNHIDSTLQLHIQTSRTLRVLETTGLLCPFWLWRQQHMTYSDNKLLANMTFETLAPINFTNIEKENLLTEFSQW